MEPIREPSFHRRRLVRGLIFLALLICGICAVPAVASAETYVVDTLAGESTGAECGGEENCSLRGAIERANEHAEEDTIEFAVAGRIDVGTVPLPGVSETLHIDATTLEGYEGKPLIELDGSETEGPPATTGIFLFADAGGSSIEGLAIGGFEIGLDLAASGLSRICGDYVGVSGDGVTPFPNGSGVETGVGSPGNRIGAECFEGNLISANSAYGIVDFGSGTVIGGNRIGLDAAGDPLPNGPPLGSAAGILVSSAAHEPFIGGFGGESGPANEIANNYGPGVLVENSDSNASIRQNSIYSNSGLGIEIVSGDALPAPELETVVSDEAGTHVSGTLSAAAPSETYNVDFYTSEACDPSGAGEGERFIGSEEVETEPGGEAAFTVNGLEPLFPGAEQVTATATGVVSGATSKFSNCITEGGPPPPVDPPQLTSTEPTSPSNQNSLLIFGSAPEGSDVRLYESGDCDGLPFENVGAEELAAGVEATVGDNSVTEFSATAETDSGISECSAPLTYVEDSTPPTATLGEPKPASPTSSTDATFNFSGEDPGGSGVAGFECRLDDAEGFEFCNSPESYTELGDGSHSFEVRAYDHAGNLSTPAEYSWEVDTAPPTTTLGEPRPANPTGSTEATFTFSGEDPGGSGVAGFECEIEDEGFEPCTSPESYNELENGPQTFAVRAVDNAGNVDPTPAEYSWTIDTTAPAVTIDSLSKAILKAGQSSELRFHSDSNGSFSLRVGGSDCATGTVLESGTYAGSPAEQEVTVQAADLQQGSNALRVCVTDAAANTGSASTAITLDTVAPTTTLGEPKPANPTGSTDATFNFSGEDPGGSGIAGFECSLDGATFATCTSPQSYTELEDASHTFEVRAVDNAGNVDPTPAEYTWTVDTSLPDVTIDSLSKTVVGPGQSSELRFHADRDGSFSLRVGGSDCGSGTVLETGDYTGSPAEAGLTVEAADLQEGSNTLRVCLTDVAANTGSESTTIVADTTAPSTQIAEPKPADPSGSASATFHFTGSDPGGSGVAGFECRLDAGAFSACASPQSYDSLSDGSHTFRVRAFDQAGNVDPTPAEYTWKIDTSKPPPAQASTSSTPELTLPINGETLAVAPKEGKVFIKLPGSNVFRPLEEYETIPVGSIVDATNGKVRLTSIDANGVTQTAYFFGGVFRVSQRDGSGLTTLRLEGGAPTCGGVVRGHALPAKPGGTPCSCPATSTASASGSRGGHRLWGSGHGNFKTEGSYGSATVRGTIWLTEDRCDGTFFKVRRGLVSIRDFPAGKTIMLPAGETYLAQP